MTKINNLEIEREINFIEEQGDQLKLYFTQGDYAFVPDIKSLQKALKFVEPDFKQKKGGKKNRKRK